MALSATTSAELLECPVHVSDIHPPIPVDVEERIVPLEVRDEDPKHVVIGYAPVVVHVRASGLD